MNITDNNTYLQQGSNILSSSSDSGNWASVLSAIDPSSATPCSPRHPLRTRHHQPPPSPLQRHIPQRLALSQLKALEHEARLASPVDPPPAHNSTLARMLPVLVPDLFSFRRPRRAHHRPDPRLLGLGFEEITGPALFFSINFCGSISEFLSSYSSQGKYI
ncbi:hypothetical protein NL676_002857 [Syzygium grande]|nr:hypothetical protein NL676_002857 [Syzygium grande]